MYSRIDDLIAFIGFMCVIAGIYLWLGIPAALIVTGIVLVYVGAKMTVRAAPTLTTEKTENKPGDETDHLLTDIWHQEKARERKYADNPLWYRRGEVNNEPD